MGNEQSNPSAEEEAVESPNAQHDQDHQAQGRSHRQHQSVDALRQPSQERTKSSSLGGLFDRMKSRFSRSFSNPNDEAKLQNRSDNVESPRRQKKKYRSAHNAPVLIEDPHKRSGNQGIPDCVRHDSDGDAAHEFYVVDPHNGTFRRSPDRTR